MSQSVSVSHVLPYVTKPAWLVVWFVAGWVGGITAVYAHYPEYRGHWLDGSLMAWARGGIPISLLLLTIQLFWRLLHRDAMALVVGLPVGAAAYLGYNWIGTRILPFWMSDSMISVWAGIVAGSLPLASLWNAHCLRGERNG